MSVSLRHEPVEEHKYLPQKCYLNLNRVIAMYRLGTADVWWRVAKDQPKELSAADQILKPLGHASVLDYVGQNRPQRVLEIGHGARSLTLDLIHNCAECWGIDSYDKEKTVPTGALDKFRESYPTTKFVNGFVGGSREQLPDQYFDLIFSVSVIEHIAEEQIPIFHKDIFRLLKPGGVVLHSFDVWWGRKTRYMFDAIEAAGLEWIEPRTEMCVPWESWLPTLSPAKMDMLLTRLAFEHPYIVHEVFSHAIPRSQRSTHNWCTILIGNRKPKA